MKTKTFKIGHHAAYGIWKLTLKGDTLKMEGIDYMSKQVQETKIFNNLHTCLENHVQNYLYEITSSYYAEKIMLWIEGNYPKSNVRF